MSGLGAIADAAGSSSGAGRFLGMTIGGTLGALSHVFMTPLYAVLLYPDRADIDPRVGSRWPLPFVAAGPHGGNAGLAGRF